jgi:hypothetical protein
MWDYIAEAHRLDLHRQAEGRRLARLARTERLFNLTETLQTVRGLVVNRLEANATKEAHPIAATQEMQPCVDAG